MLTTGEPGTREVWELRLVTLTGPRTVVLVLTEVSGQLVGTARGGDELMPLLDLTREADRLRWWQRTTRPTRLNQLVEVTVDGDRMTGTSRAGWLPESSVTGVRVA